ncbi:MAG: cytochrome P460 family protein, partial [Woeseiaceae bacterium]
ENSNNLIVETERKRIDVMQYDSRLFSETGGWGYGTFVDNSGTERMEQDMSTRNMRAHQVLAG